MNCAVSTQIETGRSLTVGGRGSKSRPGATPSSRTRVITEADVSRTHLYASGNRVAAVVAIVAALGAASNAETVTFVSGQGFNPGQVDTRITMLIGPGSLPFANPFGPADFLAARTGPHPLVVDIPNGGYPDPTQPWSNFFEGNFPIPLGPAGQWYYGVDGPLDPYLFGADPLLPNQGGQTALFCVEFTLNDPIQCAKLTFCGLGDNGLGYDPSGTLEDLPPNLGSFNEGLWINEVPLSNTITCRFGDFFTPEPDDDPTDLQVGYKIIRDITPLLHVGLNRIYIYNADLHTHSASTFNFTITTNEPMGIGSPPNIQSPIQCGETHFAPAGVPYTFTVCATDADLQDNVELSLTSPLPVGATIDLSGASGNPACITISFTPTHQLIVPQVFTFSAMDTTCEVTTCSFAVGVSECFMLLGSSAVSQPLGGGDMLYVNPTVLVPVITSPLAIPIPNESWMNGLQFFTQVIMYSPTPGAFEGDPIKTSNGLHTTIGVSNAPYGVANGMMLASPGSPQLGSTVMLYFGPTP